MLRRCMSYGGDVELPILCVFACVLYVFVSFLFRTGIIELWHVFPLVAISFSTFSLINEYRIVFHSTSCYSVNLKI